MNYYDNSIYFGAGPYKCTGDSCYRNKLCHKNPTIPFVYALNLMKDVN